MILRCEGARKFVTDKIIAHKESILAHKINSYQAIAFLLA